MMPQSGWGNPMVGGTVLRIPAIQSPNFSLVNKTGWYVDSLGNAYFFNVTATGTITATTVVVSGATGGVFIYSGAPAAGNLVGAWAGSGGSDSFGNSFVAGVQIGLSSGAQLTLTPSDGAITILTHAVSESVASQILGNKIGSGSTEQTLLTINSGVSTGQTDRVSMQMSSANQGATLSAQENFVYDDTLGGGHAYATLSAGGFSILAGSIVAVKPLTGTVGTPAVNETWHSISLVNSAWTTATGAFYRLTAEGNVQLAGQITYNQAIGGSITAGTSVQFSNGLGAGYTPTWNMQQNVEVIQRNGVSTTQGQAFITLSTGGTLSVNPFTTGFTSSTSIFSLDGLIFPVSA